MSPLFQPTETRKKRPLDLHRLLVNNQAATFFIQVEGNQFEEYGISHGDKLIIDRSRANNAHRLYVVIYENEFTLLPSHAQVDSEYTLWGAVTYIIKKC